MTQQRTPTSVTTGTRTYDDVPVSIGTPMDRIRWASVIGGLFTAFTTVVVLTVLGLAIGLSTFEADNTRNFGIGAGIYGVITAIIAFFLGGFISARTTAVAGSGNAILNGAMVWIVALPLIVNVLTTGIGSLLGTATEIAGTAAQTVAQVADDAADVAAQNPDALATAEAGVQDAIEDVQDQVAQIDEQDVEDAARDVSGPAWAALLALGLTAAASIFGGMVGKREMPTDVMVFDNDPPRTSSNR